MILKRVAYVVFNTTVLVLLAPLWYMLVVISNPDFRKDMAKSPAAAAVVFTATVLAIPIYFVALLMYFKKSLRKPAMDLLVRFGVMAGSKTIADKRLLYLLRDLFIKGNVCAFVDSAKYSYVGMAVQFMEITDRVCKPNRD